MKKGIEKRINKRNVEITGKVITLLLVAILVAGCSSKNIDVSQRPEETENSNPDNTIEEPDTAISTDEVVGQEKDVETDQQDEKKKTPEESYLEYLTSLQIHSVDAIPNALSAYQEQITGDITQEQKDRIFRYFESFFYLVQESIREIIVQDVDLEQLIEPRVDTRYATILTESTSYDETQIATAEALEANGYVAFSTEGWYYLAENPMFLYDHCSENVSDGIRQYLLLRSIDLSNGAIVSDAGLTLNWDDLADRIIAWENYAKKYPDTPEAEAATLMSQNFLDYYLTASYLDNTPMFRDGILVEGLRKSYERMMDSFPDNHASKIVAEYYSILQDNGFELTEEAEAFLKEEGFNVWSPSDVAEEETEVASTCFYPLQSSKINRISVVMTEGTFHEVGEPGVDPEWIYEGQFEIRAIGENGKVISSLNLNQSFGEEPMIFKERFTLAFEDYNSDGNLDFTISQAGTSNGNLYAIYTVMEDSTIKELPIEEGDECIFSSQFVYSTAFTRVDTTTFYAGFYDNTQGKHYNAYYKWDGSAFRLSKEEEVVQ